MHHAATPLYRTHAGLVRRLIGAAGVAGADAEDVSQDVWLAVARSAPESHVSDDARICTIVADVLKQRIRRHARKESKLEADGGEQLEGVAVSPEASFLRSLNPEEALLAKEACLPEISKLRAAAAGGDEYDPAARMRVVRAKRRAQAA